MMLGFVGALIHLKSGHPELSLAHLLGIKGHLWASNRLVRPFIFVLVKEKRDTPPKKGEQGPLINQATIFWFDWITN